MRMFNPDLLQPHAGIKPSGVMGAPDMGNVGASHPMSPGGGMPVLMAPSGGPTNIAPPCP